MYGHGHRLVLGTWKHGNRRQNMEHGAWSMDTDTDMQMRTYPGAVAVHEHVHVHEMWKMDGCAAGG